MKAAISAVNGHDREPSIEPFEPLDFVALEGKPIPQRSWLVPGWIPAGGKVTGYFGPTTAGKSTCLQTLQTAAAIGKPWLGLEVKCVRSIGIYCEDDDDDCHIRQAAINRFYDCSYTDLEDMKALPRLGRHNFWMTFDGPIGTLTPFFHQTLDFAKDFGAELVIVDPQSEVFAGDPNNPIQARFFVQHALGRMAREIAGSVILAGHPSRAGQNSNDGSSYSVQWDASFRSRLYQSATDDKDLPTGIKRELRRRASNFASPDGRMELEWQNGLFVRTDKPAPTGLLASIERHNAEQAFLDLLDRFNREGQPLSANCRAGNYAPKLFAMRPDREGYARPDFERAMQRLFADGLIINAPYGRKGDQRSKIARRPDPTPEGLT